MSMAIERGDSATVLRTVSGSDTAASAGCGDLDVLGTPSLLAWCEEATCAALELDIDSTSVGTRIRIDHLAASPVGEEVTATATVTHVDGRLLKFEVVAHDARDHVIAHGEIQRVIVDRDRFMSRLNR